MVGSMASSPLNAANASPKIPSAAVGLNLAVAADAAPRSSQPPSPSSLTPRSRALHEMESSLGRDATHELRELFRVVDKDGGGSITQEEFIELLHSLNVRPSALMMEAIYGELDSDNDGVVKYDEFLKFMINPGTSTIDARRIIQCMRDVEAFQYEHGNAVDRPMKKRHNSASWGGFLPLTGQPKDALNAPGASTTAAAAASTTTTARQPGQGGGSRVATASSTSSSALSASVPSSKPPIPPPAAHTGRTGLLRLSELTAFLNEFIPDKLNGSTEAERLVETLESHADLRGVLDCHSIIESYCKPSTIPIKDDDGTYILVDERQPLGGLLRGKGSASATSQRPGSNPRPSTTSSTASTSASRPGTTTTTAAAAATTSASDRLLTVQSAERDFSVMEVANLAAAKLDEADDHEPIATTQTSAAAANQTTTEPENATQQPSSLSPKPSSRAATAKDGSSKSKTAATGKARAGNASKPVSKRSTAVKK